MKGRRVRGRAGGCSEGEEDIKEERRVRKKGGNELNIRTAKVSCVHCTHLFSEVDVSQSEVHCV